MYEVNAEKNPMSLDLAALSMTCEGVCNGIAGIGRVGRSVDDSGGAREFKNKCIHI
jgi:hypothetical protein